MQTRSDAQLLRDYAEHGAETAFTELVQRHTNLVYSAALRQVESPDIAAEIAQSAFVGLARGAKTLAPKLAADASIAGWLCRTARNLSLTRRRDDFRRHTRERHAMEQILAAPADEPDWETLRRVLDEAMSQLSEPDYDAIVLRFFKNQDFRAVGSAIGVSDDTAQKRVARALDKLRDLLAQRGIRASATALSLAISANAVQAAPVGLALSISSAALANVSGGTLTLLKLMTATKLKLAAVGAVIAISALMALLLRDEENNATKLKNSVEPSASDPAAGLAGQSSDRAKNPGSRRDQEAASMATPEEIVTGRLAQYGRSRRELVQALAQRHGVEVPDDVKRFFDAVESGNWDEIDARFKVLAGTEPNASASAPGRQPGLEKLWPAIIDAYCAAEQTHLWPAQQLLDYGNAALDSLRPGMVYVGGTDSGRSIPEMLSDTSDGERHVVITQNGLADASYLDYLSVRYGERLNTLTGEESQREFQAYVDDVQKRLQHDQEFPNEPKQIRPGEEIQIKDGHIQVSGPVAVMAINERILKALMQKNPDLSFAAQESFPMNGTYADAIPLGPLMELGADGKNAFTADRAAESLDYWRTIAQQVLSNPSASGSSVTLWAYSNDVNATANLLAAHNFNAQAEQAYRLASQLMPSNIEAAYGLSVVLARAGRMDEARRVLDDFSRRYPDQRRAIESSRASITFVWTAPAR